MSSVSRDVLIKVARIIGGEEAVKIIDVLSQADEMTEEDIVAKTGVKLNDVRKVLYRLYEHSLVGLRRTRDKDTGWFIFYWRVQTDQIEGFLIGQKKKVLEKLEARLEYEKNHDFYYCYTPGCRRVTFEEATEYIFRCPVCSKPLTHYDNSRIIEALSRKIERIKSELNG